MYVNYADFPSLLALDDGLLAAHWMTFIPKSDGYRINIAFSRDDGKTWSKPVVPHRETKSSGSENTYAEDLTDAAAIRREIAEMARQVLHAIIS